MHTNKNILAEIVQTSCLQIDLQPQKLHDLLQKQKYLNKSLQTKKTHHSLSVHAKYFIRNILLKFHENIDKK